MKRKKSWTPIQSTQVPPTTPLPDRSIALLFEGTWFFTEDPDDPTRILGICPYTNAPDHICECGQWNSDNDQFVGPDGTGSPGIMQEKDRFWVNVTRDQDTQNTFSKVFDTASQKFSFVYFKKGTGCQPLRIKTSDPLMRHVSISMPDLLLMDGKLTSGVITSGTTQVKGKVCSQAKVTPSSYIAFIFVYNYKQSASLELRTNCLQQTIVTTEETPNPHLVFRVRSPGLTDEDKCPLDCSAENSHIMSTFDMLRRVVVAPGAGPNGSDAHFDIAFYPQPGPPAFDWGNTGLTSAELGLGDMTAVSGGSGRKRSSIFYQSLASCASGPAGA